MAKGYSFVDEVENPLEMGVRNATGLGTTALKTAVNLPGDIAQTVYDVGRWGNKKFGEPGGSRLPEVKVPIASEYLVDPIIKKLLPPGYTEPKSEKAKLAHDVVSDLTGMFLPIPGVKGVPFKKAIVASGLGNMASWLGGQIGMGENGKTGLKLGTMIASTMSNPFKLKQYARDVYSHADSLIPEGAHVAATKLEPVINDIDKILSRGHMTPNKLALKEVTDTVKNKIKDGSLPVSDAWELKKNMNEMFKDSSKLKGVEQLAPQLTHGLNEVLDEYGKKNPAFPKSMREGDNLWTGIHKASKLNKFLQDTINKKSISVATAGLLLGHGMGFHVIPSLSTVAKAMALRGTVQGFEALKNSSAIRSYYKNILSAATKQNTKAVIKNVAAMDRLISKDFPEHNSSPMPTHGYSFVE